MGETFTVFLQGNSLGGYATFWKSNNSYYYQCNGIGEATRCSKKLYEEAKELYKKSHGITGCERITRCDYD